ncbi:MAG: flippase [candidate division WWE3 bacterium]|nr:flippase [candidate division WWE3 bacterium]
MASSTNKVVANTFYQIFGRLFSAAETLVATYFLARALGTSGYGDLTIILTFTGIFSVISDFGINVIIVREWSLEALRIKKEFTQLVVFRVVLALFLTVLASVVVLVLSHFSSAYNPLVVKGILVGLLLVTGQSLYYSCTAIFQTTFSYVKSFLASIWGNLGALVLIIVGIVLHVTFLKLVLLLVVGSLLPTAISLFYVRTYFDFTGFKLDLKFWKRIFIASLPTGLGLIINTLYTSADRVMLSLLSTTTAIGLYGLSYKIFENILVIPNFFMNASYPVVVAHRAESADRVSVTVQKLFDALCLAVFPIVTLGVILSVPILNLIGGAKFVVGAPVLVLLFLGLPIYFISPLFRWLIIVEKKEWWLPFIYAGGLISNVLLNLYLIRRFDILGAALANAISELLVLVIIFIVLRRALNLKLRFNYLVIAVLGSLFMAPFVNLFKDWYFVGPIILGGIAYFLAVYLLTRGQVLKSLRQLISK